MNDVNKVMTYVVFKQKHTKVNVYQPSSIINATISIHGIQKKLAQRAWELPVADEPIQGS